MTERPPKYFIDFLKKGKHRDKVEKLFPNIRPYVFNPLAPPETNYQKINTFRDFATYLKVNFEELTGTDEEVIYLYLKKYKKYNKKLFLKVIQQINKYRDELYEAFSVFFDEETYNDEVTKPVFLFALTKWYKQMTKYSGIFNMDIFDILTTKGMGFSIRDTSPRDQILDIFDKIYNI